MNRRYLTLAPLLVLLTSSCRSGPQKAVQEDAPASGPTAVAGPLPADPAAPLELNSKVRTGVLKNGLTYFVRENKQPEKRAEFWLVVNAGSFHEDNDQRGLAHFVEHMAFNGTASFPKNELLSKLQKLGVKFGPHINAMTTFDETVYKLRVPTDDPATVALTLQILSEWAEGITFLPEDLDAERGVVLSEKRGGQGAEMRMAETLISNLFQGTRYADRLPIGKPEVLKTASPELLKRFYRDWYHPKNMAVMAVGDFDAAEIEKAVEARFASLRTAEHPRAQPKRNIPTRSEPLVISISDEELPISAVVVGRLLSARPKATMNDFRRDFIEGAVAQMISKRLEEAQKKGNARFLMAAGGPAPIVRAADGFGFLAAVKPDEMREGLEDLLAELERARRHGFVATEFERAKNELISSLENTAKEAAADKESSTDLVEELVRHFLTNEGMPGRSIELAIFKHFAETVPLSEVGAVMQEFLSAKDLAVVSVAPKGGSTLSRDDVLVVLGELAGKQLVAYADEKSDEPLLAPIPTAGTIKSKKQHSDVGVHEWVLSNGARIVLKPTTFKEDEILLYAGSPGGSSLSDAKSLKETFLASSAVGLGGLGSFTSTTLEKALAGRQVSVAPFISEHHEGVRASSSVADLETMMQLVHLTFQAPRADKKAFEVWKDSRRQEVRLASNKPEVRFARRLAPLQSNNNPRSLVWNDELAKALSLESSMVFYKNRFMDASDFTFVIVGSFDLKTIEPLVLTYLGSLPDIDRDEDSVVHRWPAHKKKSRLVVRDGTTERAQLTLFFNRAINPKEATAKQRAAWQLFGAALELQFLDVFREQLGDTYSVGVDTAFRHRWNYATMNIGLQSEPKRAAALEKRMLAEIVKAVSVGVSKENFVKARQGARKELETRLQQNRYWQVRLFDAYFNQRPLSEIEGLEKVFADLTEADLTATAKSFVDPDKPVVGILLPKK